MLTIRTVENQFYVVLYTGHILSPPSEKLIYVKLMHGKPVICAGNVQY